MVKRLFSLFNVFIAMSAGIIVLIGYFIESPVITGLHKTLLQWAVILAGVAVLIGVWNMFSVHINKLKQKNSGYINSAVFIIFFTITAVVSIPVGLKPVQTIILNGILIPAEISLLALLSVTLLYALFQLFKTNLNFTTFVFLLTALFVLIGTGPLPVIGQIPFFSDYVRPFITNYLVSGGARGILIGVALGILTTGLRILFGKDRPYGGK